VTCGARGGEGGEGVRVLLLTGRPEGGKSLLPALELLDHAVAVEPLEPQNPTHAGRADVVLVDATGDLSAAAHATRTVAANLDVPVLVVIGEGGLAALKPTWGFHDWLLPGAPPAEVETRLRLLADRRVRERRPASVGDLAIDEETYVVRLRGAPLDLTYREFELLKFLAHNPGRVFTRVQLLQEVWGYDYFGGTRTVDVHIRRLRAKLGAEHESLIGTVRGVGYKLDPAGLTNRGGS
jgi:DNA-binding response OmpR family regulator